MGNAYTKKTRIELEIGVNSALLNDVLDDDLDQIIEDQSRLIDSYVQTVVATELDDIDDTGSNLPTILIEICTCLVKYKLWTRKSFKDIPEHVQKEYSAQLKLLEKIQNGKISVGDLTDDDADVLEWESDSKYFTVDL